MLTVDAVELVVVVVGARAALVVGVLALQDAELKQHHRLVCHHHHQPSNKALRDFTAARQIMEIVGL